MTLTQPYLKRILRYDPKTGVFTWRKSGPRVRAGSVAGCVDDYGYRVIGIDLRTYHAHRLAWFYMTGKMPKDEISHIDENRDNNRWSNLRQATLQQSKWNQKKVNNTSGFNGVSWHKQNKRWMARIGYNDKEIYLGSFATAEEAARAYDEAAIRLFGEFARPNF
jgi:HNH endonuclease/AP2 domain-containing protein